MKNSFIYILPLFVFLVSCGNETYDNIPESEANNEEEILVTPCLDGLADGYPCLGYDLVAHLPLSVFDAQSGNDAWGWTDPLTQKEYVLMGLNTGTAFVDISQADDPIYLGILPRTNETALQGDAWRDVKVFQNHAFVVSEASNHGLQVFDLTRLRNVENPPQVFTTDAHYTEIGNAHNVVINEKTGFAYTVGSRNSYNGGPHFINILNPKAPTPAGGYGGHGYSHDAQVVSYRGPDEDYTGKEIYIGSNENELVLIDVTDKANPTPISSVTYPDYQYTHQGWFDETQKYFFVGDELDEVKKGYNTRTLVFDMSDLKNPLLHYEYLGSLSTIDHNGYVLGNTFYLANYTSGVRMIDISQIETKKMTEIGFFDTYPDHDNTTFNGVWNVYPYFDSGIIVVSDINSGLFLIQKSK